jgi:hypothetical protein
MKGEECHEAPISCVDHRTSAYTGPLSDVLRRRCVTVVSKANEEYRELYRNGTLWDLGVVVKDVVEFNEFHETIKHVWRHA